MFSTKKTMKMNIYLLLFSCNHLCPTLEFISQKPLIYLAICIWHLLWVFIPHSLRRYFESVSCMWQFIFATVYVYVWVWEATCNILNIFGYLFLNIYMISTKFLTLISFLKFKYRPWKILCIWLILFGIRFLHAVRIFLGNQYRTL